MRVYSTKENRMKKRLLAVLVVLAFVIGGCETFSFGQLGSIFTKAGDVLSDECADVPTSEVKACLEALKNKATEDEAVEDEAVE
jgi:hypothetical protein